MKCDSRASFLAHTFTSLYFGREPKAKGHDNVVLTLFVDQFHVQQCQGIMLF